MRGQYVWPDVALNYIHTNRNRLSLLMSGSHVSYQIKNTITRFVFRPAKGLARPLDSLVAEADDDEEPLSSFFTFASFFFRIFFLHVFFRSLLFFLFLLAGLFCLLRLFFFLIFISFASFFYIPEEPG